MRKIYLFQALMILLFCAVVIAAENNEASKDSLKSLDRIVVTGTKTEKSIELAPVKTTVIGREDIERYSACNLYEVLDGTPGIRMEQQCNNCNFSLMRMSGLEGGYAKILIDGMPVYSGLAGVYGMQQIQAGLIEQIEIVKGAGSALYGSDAIAGVVNVITKKPSPKPSMTIGASIGMNPADENREGNMPLSSSVHFSASHRIGKFAAVIAGQSNTEQEINNNYDFIWDDDSKDMLTDRVASKNLGGTVKFSFYDALGDNSEVGFMGRAIYENRMGGNLDKDDFGNYYIDNPLDESSEHITTERYEGGLTLEKELPSKTTLKGMLNVVSHGREATNGAAWEIQEEFPHRQPRPYLTDERTVVGEINGAQKLGDKNTLLLGFQAKKTDVDENINGGGWYYRSFQDIGVFLQDEMDISEKFGFVAGIRYDNHSSYDELTGDSYDESAFSPRVSLRFTPSDVINTRLSWGTGFRVPGDFSEDAHLCSAAPTIQKSGDLDPEKSMGVNVSLDLKKDRFAAGLGLFHTNIENKVYLDDYSNPLDPNDNSYELMWANAEGKSFSQGFELSLGYELDFFEIGGSYVLNRAQYDEEQIPGNEDSKNIPRSPLNSGNVNVALFSSPLGEGFKGGWRLDVGLNIVGKMFIERDGDVVEEWAGKGVGLEDFVETNGYVLLDARINKNFPKAGLDIFVAGENLANTVQERRQYDIEDAAMIFAPLYGPTINLGMKKTF